MQAFEIEQTNIVERVRSGHASFGVRVTGYWSSDVIRIYVRRNLDWNTQKFNWTIEVTHSSGGRDSKQVEDDLDAEENFGNAMLAAVKFARELRLRQDEFEVAYQIYQAELQAWSEEQAREKQAKIDADPALTKAQVKEMIEKISKQGGRINLIERGSETGRITTITTRYVGNLSFYVNRNRYSKKDVIQMLSNASARTEYSATR